MLPGKQRGGGVTLCVFIDRGRWRVYLHTGGGGLVLSNRTLQIVDIYFIKETSENYLQNTC